MSTDLPEGNEPQRGGTGRPPRVGDSRSPVGSTLSIVLAVVAVVAGFLILRALTDDDDGETLDPGGASENTGPDVSIPDLASTPPGGSTGAGGGGPTTTAAPAETRSGATIAVANASGVGGSAAAMSTALTGGGFEGVGEPGNSNGETLTESVVYFDTTDTAAQAVARTLAADLGGVAAEAMPDPRPVDGAGDTSTATVLVLIGTDTAGQSLADLAGDAAIEAPEVAGNTATSAPDG